MSEADVPEQALRSLLRLALERPGGSLDERCDWTALAYELESHRLTPLIAYTLRREGLDTRVPALLRSCVYESFRHTTLVNLVHAESLARIVGRLREQEIEPIVFKGLVLAAGYYPDPGARPMVDLDILVGEDELERSRRVLEYLGFQPDVVDGEPDLHGFTDSRGIAIDLHWEFRLFPPELRPEITRLLALPRARTTVTTWTPDALLVHLVVHLAGHREKTGIVLAWVIDIAFLLLSGETFSAARVRELVPSAPALEMIGQVLGFLDRELGVEPPGDLAVLVPKAQHLTLERILRDRRLKPWGLPSWVGWLRLAGSRLRGRPSQGCRYPSIGDLWHGIVDRIAE